MTDPPRHHGERPLQRFWRWWRREEPGLNQWHDRHRFLLWIVAVIAAPVVGAGLGVLPVIWDALAPFRIAWWVLLAFLSHRLIRWSARRVKWPDRDAAREVLTIAARPLASAIYASAAIAISYLVLQELGGPDPPPQPSPSVEAIVSEELSAPPESTAPPPSVADTIVVDEFVGESIEAARAILASEAVDIVERPVLRHDEPVGVIVAQDPDPGTTIDVAGEIELVYVAKPKTIDLTDTLLPVSTSSSPCYDQWERDAIPMGRRTYPRGWWWRNRYQCGGGRRHVVVQAPTDPSIKEVRVLLGIPTDAYVPTKYEVRVVVTIDNGAEKEYVTTVVKPVLLRARRFTRMDIVFFARDSDIPVAVARVWGLSVS